jgi:hypothetical protein
MAETGGCGELLASSDLSIPPCGAVMAYAAFRFSFGLIVVVLVASQSLAQTAQTARDITFIVGLAGSRASVE